MLNRFLGLTVIYKRCKYTISWIEYSDTNVLDVYLGNDKDGVCVTKIFDKVQRFNPILQLPFEQILYSMGIYVQK